MADWHQSGMFYMPSLVSVYEMTGDFPCEPCLWDAESASKYSAEIRRRKKRHITPSIRDCVGILMGEQFSESERLVFQDVSISNLYLIALGDFSLLILFEPLTLMSTSIHLRNHLSRHDADSIDKCISYTKSTIPLV